MPSTSNTGYALDPILLCGYGVGNFASGPALMLLYFLTGLIRLES